MNIFVLDRDQQLCAQYHCDKHAVKMIVEYAQLLSTAHRILDGRPEVVSYLTKSGKRRNKTVYYFPPHAERPDVREAILYKATHVNHPCAVWARTSLNNYQWLVSLLDNLCAEYTKRYGRIHKVQASGLLKALYRNPKALGKLPPDKTEHPQTMPDQFKRPDVVDAYRAFYAGDKARFAKWKNGNPPYFM